MPASSPADDDFQIGAVFVAHQDVVGFASSSARLVPLLYGAPLLTSSYAPTTQAQRPDLQPGAMVTAALAKVSGAEPIVVGSRPPALDAVAIASACRRRRSR